jgi:hypothetical protein
VTENQGGTAWQGDDDPWAGAVDENGFPIEDVYGGDVAPHEAPAPQGESTIEERIAARFRLPEEFWGTRNMFKVIRQAAWASQTHPDAVLACVLARASGAIGNTVKFDSGRGPHGSLNLFVCLLAKSGIGKSEAARAARHAIQLPRHLLRTDGTTNMETFRDGLGIGTGEGMCETYMGTVEMETGNMIQRGKNMIAETEKVRTVVRHRAFFYVDEGEVLTKLMRERSGATLGPTLRSAWNGEQLGQANAKDETTRLVPPGMYSMGVAIGYQPDTAIAMLADVGPGTPQRFLWFGAQDTEMPTERQLWPERITLPTDDAPQTGLIDFPEEIKDWFFRHTYGKHHGTIEVNAMDSHEPLMRAKLAALLCYLDGRMMVNQDDWTLGAMIWNVSRSIRDRLIEHRDRVAEEQRQAQRREKVEDAQAVELVKRQVSTDIERVARRIANKVHGDFGEVKRYVLRKNFGRDKPHFDAGLAYAEAMGWVVVGDDEGGLLTPGASQPS